MRRKRERLSALLQRRVMAGPKNIIAEKREALERIKKDFRESVKRRFREKEQRLDFAMERLEILSPVRLLRRGYGILEKEDGKLIRGARDVQKGDVITAVLADGRIRAKVTETERGGK